MTEKVYNRKIRDIKEELLRPYYHILPTKSSHMLVKQIPESFQYWLNIPEDKLRAIQHISEMLLNYSILCDDIQDNSLYRRSIPAAHCVFGVPLTINASMHILGIAMEKILELGHPMALSSFVSNFVDLWQGQGMEIYWRENLICVNEDDFKKAAEKKASGMFLMSVRLMQLFSDNKTDYSKLIKLFGIYYEIRDGYCNLVKQEQLDGHERREELQVLNENTFCEDLTDGKFSWPVLHALNSPEANTIIYILKQRTRDPGMKRYFLSILQRLGSLQYTREVLHEYDRMLREELARLGGNPLIEEFLEDMKNWADD